MRLSEICVNRPVFAFMLIMFAVVLGVFSFFDLGVDLFPRTDPATVYVRVRLPGATPEEVTSQVVMPLEEAIASVSGIDEMRAMVSEGQASIIVTFVLERDIGEASEDVREKVSGAIRNLPPNVLPPVVQKADPDSDSIITMVVSGQRTTRELTEITDKQIRRALETIDGVAAVDISGGTARQINVFLDLDKLSGYSLTAQDVERSVRSENIEAPGGRMIRGASELGVRTLGRVEEVPEFNNIIVKSVGGAPVRIRDIGHAEDGTAERRTFAYYNGKPAVVMEVRRQTGTNTVQVVEAIKKRLDSLRKELPAGVKIDVVKDQATYIKASVASLEEHLVLGSLFASLIVFLFIRNWRTVLIASIAIPTSIITTFTLIRAMDFTLNSMTLLGLTLAVGIVIDDAIIVLENIYRYIDEKDVPPMQAAIHATKEISLAVFATTVSLVIIFVPIAFMTGYARRFVNQFGWTMAMSIMMSMLVAFTLTPTLSARILRKSKKPHTGGSRGRPRLLGSHLRGHAPVVAAPPLGDHRRLHGYVRVYVRDQQVRGARLDAAGGPERAFGVVRAAGGLLARDHGEVHRRHGAADRKSAGCDCDAAAVVLEQFEPRQHVDGHAAAEAGERARGHQSDGGENPRRDARCGVGAAAHRLPERAGRARLVLPHPRHAAWAGHQGDL